MKTLGLAAFILLLASMAVAQTSTPTTPPLAPVSGTIDSDTPAPRYEDNVRPLGGVQSFDLGNRTELFNLLTPALDFSQSYGTNPGLRTGPGGETVWGAVSNMGGSLQLTRTKTNQQFSMSYHGAAQLNSYDSNLDTQVHSLNLIESITAGRWHYVLGNEFSYEPNAYGAATPLLFPGSDPGTGSGFRPGLGPDTNILTEQNTRLNEIAIGQVSYGLSRSSLITANATYGILHYTDVDLLDSKQLNLGGGYNHRFGRNTIGVNYTYSDFRFSQVDENFDTNSVELAYGRRIIGRWSVEIGAGPTLIRSHFATSDTTDFDVNARGSLQYASNRTRLGFGYQRGVTAGAGIVPGAVTDSFSGSYQRRLTQTLTFDTNGGYSRNSANKSATTYNSLFAVANLTRQVGRYITVSFGYTGQKQISDQSFANFSSNAAVVSLHWRFRPIRLE